MNDFPLHELKHDLFSLIFKVDSSIDLLCEEPYFKQVAKENLGLLQRTIKRLVLQDKLKRKVLSYKPESFNPSSTLKEIFKFIEEKEKPGDCHADYNLFTEALSALKESFKDEPKVITYKNRFILTGKTEEHSKLKVFFLEVSQNLLKELGFKFKQEEDFIEVSWEEF